MTASTRRCLGAAILLSVVAMPTQAFEPLGFYVGAGAGTGRMSAGPFKESDTAYRVATGIRPLSTILGVEAAYADYGTPTGFLSGVAARGSLTMGSVAAVLYLLIPVPFVDVYGKFGIAQARGTVNAPQLGYAARFNESGYTAGAGVQVKLGAVGVRGEYEHLDANRLRGDMLSISLIASFF